MEWLFLPNLKDVLDDLTISTIWKTWNHSGEQQGPPGSGANCPMQMNEMCIIIDL